MNILLFSALTLVSAANILELPISRNFTRITIPTKDGSTGVSFDRETFYANITVDGLPYTTHLEPESGDLWVFENSRNKDRFAPSGEFVKFMGREFEFGMYYADNVTYGPANFKMPYAVINKELNVGDDPTTGGLGLGPKGSPIFEYFMATLGERKWYQNFADHIYYGGYAHSNAFSIELAADPADGGKLVFGAFDTSRLIGSLKPIYRSPSTKLINAVFNISGISTNAGLDIEDPNTYLDDEVVAAVAKKFGAEWDDNHGLYQIADIPQDDLVLTIDDNFELRVPPSDVWVQDKQVSENWYFTIRPRSSYTLMPKNATLGADILKSACIVWDLGHNLVGIGQANRNPEPVSYQNVLGGGIPIYYLTNPAAIVPI